jgi:hypothetical protein
LGSDELVNPTSRYTPTYSVGFFVLIIFILQGGKHTIYTDWSLFSEFISIIFDRATYKTTKNQEKIRKTNYLVQNQEIRSFQVF